MYTAEQAAGGEEAPEVPAFHFNGSHLICLRASGESC